MGGVLLGMLTGLMLRLLTGQTETNGPGPGSDRPHVVPLAELTVMM